MNGHDEKCNRIDNNSPEFDSPEDVHMEEEGESSPVELIRSIVLQPPIRLAGRQLEAVDVAWAAD